MLLISIANAQIIGHQASEISAGIFGAGDFIFPNKLGIGNITPTETLEIIGNVKLKTTTVSAILKIDSTNSYSSIDFFDNGIGKWGIGKNPQNNFYIDLTGVGNSLTIDSNRNVGIGTTNPTAKLEVIGDVLASGTICDSNGCIGAGGSGVSGTVIGGGRDRITDSGYKYREFCWGEAICDPRSGSLLKCPSGSTKRFTGEEVQGGSNPDDIKWHQCIKD